VFLVLVVEEQDIKSMGIYGGKILTLAGICDLLDGVDIVYPE
jgi:hypothetical protein